MDRLKKIVVLASGRGSNFEAIAQAVNSGSLKQIEICGLISNRANAKALEVARAFKIPSFTLESKQYKDSGVFNRQAYEFDLGNLISSLDPDWICLAGYLLLLGPEIIKRFSGQIINIHPSLLPRFKGLRAQEQALKAGATETGCSVHFVTEELDAGPIIIQKRIAILPSDTEESLSARLLPLEHQAYVEALAKITSDNFSRESR